MGGHPNPPIPASPNFRCVTRAFHLRFLKWVSEVVNLPPVHEPTTELPRHAPHPCLPGPPPRHCLCGADRRLLRTPGPRSQDRAAGLQRAGGRPDQDRKSTRLNSSHSQISYAVFCLKKKNGLTIPVTTSMLSSTPENI